MFQTLQTALACKDKLRPEMEKNMEQQHSASGAVVPERTAVLCSIPSSRLLVMWIASTTSWWRTWRRVGHKVDSVFQKFFTWFQMFQLPISNAEKAIPLSQMVGHRSCLMYYRVLWTTKPDHARVQACNAWPLIFKMLSSMFPYWSRWWSRTKKNVNMWWALSSLLVKSFSPARTSPSSSERTNSWKRSWRRSFKRQALTKAAWAIAKYSDI